MSNPISEIVRNFAIDVKLEAYGNGHINDTYIADSEPKYILQRINHAIFKNPEQVMGNILGVTEYLREKITSGVEDEVYLDKIYFDLELFEAFTKGFLEEVGDKLTPAEIELLPFSAKLLTYECGMRFLGDYLNGDTYFKIHCEHHNLDRARTQFKLVADIESKMEEMKKIVEKYI